MNLPDYWLTRPAPPPDESTRAAFDALLDAALSAGGCPEIGYDLPQPKWQFLCHAADRHGLAVHGSGDPAIQRFEPRQSNDLNDFGNQKAVYAASDGLWAMFFAVVDRARVGSITNACVTLAGPDGALRGPYYVFSVSRPALPERPWHSGTVYLLPRETFVTQAPMPFGDRQVPIAQLASFEPVAPLAKLSVAPEDFPFLAQIRGHDDERLAEYASALQNGLPWPAD